MHRSSRRSSTRHTKNFASAAKTAYRHFDRAGSSFGKWLVTDHTGFSKSMLDMPWIGFKETLYQIIVRFLIAVVGAVLSGLMVFVMIAYGIPALLKAMFI
jgi:hypothetical protein